MAIFTAMGRPPQSCAQGCRPTQNFLQEQPMFPLVGQIFLGLIIGTLAKLIIPGKEPGGVIATALIGLAGSTLGTCFSRIFIGANQSLGHSLGWIFSGFGALIPLAIYRFSIGDFPSTDGG